MGLISILDDKQFKQLLFLLNANNGALNKLAENVSPPENSVVEALRQQDETLLDGFNRIVTVLENLIAPVPTPDNSLEVKFMFIVKDDNPAVNFSLSTGDVTDAEGNAITDAQIDVDVVSSDDSVLAVTFDKDAKTGTVSFGNPGVASLTASVMSGENVIGSGAADFTVTVGDPAKVSNVALKFDGLEEAPTQPAEG